MPEKENPAALAALTIWSTQAKAALIQAAACLEIEAREWRDRPAPDHLGRAKKQLTGIADNTEKHAAALRELASEMPEAL